MATRQGDWDCMATGEQIDTCNEVHKRLVDLNLHSMLIDQQLKKLTQECSERDDNEVSFLKMAVEEVKEDQHSTKQMLRELLIQLFQPTCFDIGSLKGFVLEQEVYNLLMSTKRDNVELKCLMAKIEGFMRSVDERNKKVNNLKMDLDRIPKKSNFTTWNLGQFGDESITSRRLVNEAFKDDSVFDVFDEQGKRFDPMDYLDPQNFSGNCWGCVCKDIKLEKA